MDRQQNEEVHQELRAKIRESENDQNKIWRKLDVQSETHQTKNEKISKEFLKVYQDLTSLRNELKMQADKQQKF